jgi:hypothetical protein
VTAYYFYVVDGAFGPAFIKICAYFPCPIKIWLNGHEYTKRAAAAAGSDSPSWITGLLPSMTRPGCNGSATCWDRVRSGVL